MPQQQQLVNYSALKIDILADMQESISVRKGIDKLQHLFFYIPTNTG
jgi:hypothetical protein